MKPILLAAAVLAAGISAPLAQSGPAETPEQYYQRICDDSLSFLPNIRKTTVAALDDSYHYVIHPTCEGVNMNDFGNAVGLSRTIAANPVLSAFLARWNYRPSDVVGIRVDGNTVQVWAHHF